mmetsp:Transcript_37/g.54  ORF Transcript_37/g.54 Transcript_37/m.54 type:complete len:422 (-) Transcript_37:36-1301(-)
METSIDNTTSSFDLHEAILANSYKVVCLLLEREADPNKSPQLPPIGVLSATHQEQSRELHRNLCRVFRSHRDGNINPLIVAVCNAYHQSASHEQENALHIIEALVKAGADTEATCNNIAFCKIGIHPSITVASPKTAYKIALLLKRFPRPDEEESCCRMMDSVASIILTIKEQHPGMPEQHRSCTEFSPVPTQVKNTWKALFEKDNSFSDLVFVCPDGRVNAHKCILAAATSYFRAALSGSWIESSSSSHNEWKTSNSVRLMRAVLRFIYTGELSAEDLSTNNFEYLRDLLSVASEYQLQALEDVCEVHLTKILDSPASYKASLCLASLYNLPKLKHACFEYIKENPINVLLDSDFTELANENGDIWEELSEYLTKTQRKRKLIDNAGAHKAVRVGSGHGDSSKRSKTKIHPSFLHTSDPQ